MAIDASAVIGLLIGFLVVGTVGIYVGEEMISAAGLTGTSTTVWTTTGAGTMPWTVPADVTTADFLVVGSGGGGGSGANFTFKGGGAGAAGEIKTWTGVALTTGWVVNTTIGAEGIGGLGAGQEVRGYNGTAGGKSYISIGTTFYNASGGTWGMNETGTGVSATKNGVAGVAGYSTGVYSDTGGNGSSSDPSLIPGIAGAVGVGYGAGGPGGGAGDAGTAPVGITGDGTGGDGAEGFVQITYYTTNAGLNALGPTQQSIVDTFALGVNLCKIIVIVSIASIIFMLLQKTGLIPRFGQE